MSWPCLELILSMFRLVGDHDSDQTLPGAHIAPLDTAGLVFPLRAGEPLIGATEGITKGPEDSWHSMGLSWVFTVYLKHSPFIVFHLFVCKMP